MAGMEGDKRPGRHEAAFNAGISGGAGQQPGSGERDNQRPRQSAENRILSVVSTVQRQEGEPIDPYLISDKLMSYQDDVHARLRGMTLTQRPGKIATYKQTRTPTEEDQAFFETIKRVRAAYDIVAFSRFPPNYQQAISMEVYDEDTRRHTPQESITLTEAEKAILTHLTNAAGIDNDPMQRTYSYGSIPHIVYAKHTY